MATELASAERDQRFGESGYIQLRRDPFRRLMRRGRSAQRLVLWALFHELLMRANFESGYLDEELLQRGQCVAGREELAMAIGTTESKVRTSLNKLEEWGELAIKTTSRGMVITVVYYDTYVAPPAEKDQRFRQQIASTSPTNDQQIATQKNEEQENEELEIIMTCDDEPKSGTLWHSTPKGKELKNRLSSLRYNLAQRPSYDALEDFVSMHGVDAVEHFVSRAETGKENGSLENPGGMLYRWFSGDWGDDDEFSRFLSGDPSTKAEGRRREQAGRNGEAEIRSATTASGSEPRRRDLGAADGRISIAKLLSIPLDERAELIRRATHGEEPIAELSADAEEAIDD